MAVDFAGKMKEAEKAGLLSSGDYFKIKEGANRFRLMSECLAHPGTFNGRNNFKWLCYVLDRTDGKVKPMFMPHTIYKVIVGLQQNPDYEFFDVPLPYDLTINAAGAGTKEVKYTVLPARKNTDVTPDELAALKAMKPLDELQKALKEKNDKAAAAAASAPQPPAHHDDDDPSALTDDDIPF
jgi:hypothetical protein